MSGCPNNLPAGMFFNYFITNLPPNIPPTGRLVFFLPVWKRITQDPWVLQVVQGYQLELLSTPVQQNWHPLRVSLSHQAVLNQEVQALLDKRAVHQVQNNDSTGFTSSLFVVPKKDGGNGGNRPEFETPKPILVYEHFKMEGIHMLRDLLRKGDYLVTIDLKDVYLTVPIWKGHQKYLRFLWKDTMLEFACLPFGLATAPRVFTKLMKPVVAMLRQRGVHPNYIFRRHFDNGRVRRSSAPPSCFDPEFPRKSGVCNQLQEIPTCTKRTDGIFRFSYRFRNYVAPITR
jgi:hypothetical protein